MVSDDLWERVLLYQTEMNPRFEKKNFVKQLSQILSHAILWDLIACFIQIIRKGILEVHFQ